MNEVLESTAWTALATSIACGALIGIERERRKTESTIGNIAGLRTFACTALLGTVVQMLEIPGLVICAALLLIVLIAISYFRSDKKDPGITTEVALFLTYLVGITAYRSASLAAGITVCLTILLLARSRLHRFATETLTPSEIRDGLILASAITIILPVLPNSPVDSLGIIDPRKIWMVVVLLLAIQTVAHVGMRILGRRYGLALFGFAAGFVSSTSTFAAMAARSKVEPDLANKFALACLLSHLASLFQLIALVSFLAPQMLVSIAASIGITCAGLAIASYFSIKEEEPEAIDTGSNLDKERSMFNPTQTLIFAVLLSALMIGMSWIAYRFGDQATKYVAIIAGMADMHASSAAILSVAATSPLDSVAKQEMLVTILTIVSLNALAKLAISFAGSRSLFKKVAPTLLLATMASWAFVALF
jgi:uncharacterized membrane protein (DUF4010 family)